MQDESASRRKRNKRKGKKKGIAKSIDSEGDTPGNIVVKEESVNFNHKYYETSINMIDLLLLGAEKEIKKLKLQTEVKISNVFYEEPLEYDNFLQKSLNKQSRKDQDWRKQMERRKYLEIKSEGNDSEQLYLINSQWVKWWVSFLQDSHASLPGPIVNDDLYLKLETKKNLKIGEDLFIVSQRLWNVFFDWYGGGPTLKWKIEIEQSPAEESNRPSQLSPDNQADYKINYNSGTGNASSRSMADENKLDFKKLTSKKNQDIFEQEQEKEKVQQSASKFGIKKLQPGMDISEFTRPISQPEQKSRIFKPSFMDEDEVTRQPTDSSRDSDEAPVERKKSKKSKKSDNTLRVFGLENNSLYCYLNSVLQCVFSIAEMREFYEQGEHKKIKVRNPMIKGLKFSNFIQEFSQDINKIQKNRNIRVLKTTKLKSIIKSDFSPIREQDSHEFLLYFLNNLKDELTEKGTKLPQSSKNGLSKIWKEYTSNFPSIVDTMFTAIEKTQVQCKSCRKEVESLQFHLCFPLQVEGIKSINQSLRLYSSQEELPDYTCENCKKKLYCSLQRKIIKLPEVFIFQLQRFSMYPRMRKIRGLIEFPETLNMEKFTDPNYVKEGSNQPCVYELMAVAVHLGSINGGHYVSYAKKEDDAWYYMDDERVGKVSIQEVLQQDAYLLFYKRIND